jgi:hypothetical protein
MDNFKTRDASAFFETFEPAESKRVWVKFVFTPKHGSWLNMFEIELHVLNGQCLNRHISTIKKLMNKLMHGKLTEILKINWQFTNSEARKKLKKLDPSIHA